MEPLLKPLNEVSLTSDKPVAYQVLELLRATILYGDLKPGRRLSEQEIADLLQVSRQPVREAFIRLADEGLVEIRPQRGTYVSRISPQEVFDSRFVREAVEADLVRLASNNITTEVEARLASNIAEQKRAAQTDPLSFMALDEELHRIIAETAEKPQIWDYLQKLKSQFDRVRFLVAVELPTDQLIAQHEAIVAALIERDADKAETALRTHLRQVIIDLPKVMHMNPDYFSEL